MTELAFIAPTKFLNRVSSKGDIHLVLAHLVLQDEEYRNYYKNEKKYKILDNGAFELGQPLPVPQIIEAAELIGADEVVAPDVFNSCEKTLDAVKDFTCQVRTLLPAFKCKEYKFKVMAVPHGKDCIDWLNCFKHLYDNPQVDVIGIGYKSCRALEAIFSGTLSQIRSQVLTALLKGPCPNKTIHLLGGGTNPIEILDYRHLPQVRSMDTCFPFLCGQHGMWFSDTTGAERPEKATLDLTIDKLSDYQLEIVDKNIDIMRRWVELGRIVS